MRVKKRSAAACYMCLDRHVAKPMKLAFQELVALRTRSSENFGELWRGSSENFKLGAKSFFFLIFLFDAININWRHHHIAHP